MSIQTENTALLVMDVQHAIVDRISDKEAYLTRVRAAVDAAHGKGVQVRYVVVGFRPGLPEVSSRNQSFAVLKQQNMPALIDPHPVLEPTGSDIVITKRRVSAFAGSDLEVVLRGGDIQHLVLAGIATSGVVLSTVREAADKDYRITVLSDLCADFDEEVHRVLCEKVFPRQAQVMTGEAWITSLG